MEFKQITLDEADLKFAADGSLSAFKGYASVFGGVDSHGDTIHPGAYRHAIGDGAEVKMYFNHGWIKREIPIGKMFVREDERGLLVERAEFTKGIRMADEAALAVQHKTVNGLSVGFRIAADGYERKPEGGRHIRKIAFLKEVSVVDWPSDRDALLDAKSAIEEAETLKDIESLLRDAAGFSRADACALVSRIKSLAHGDRDPETKLLADELAAAFQQFRAG